MGKGALGSKGAATSVSLSGPAPASAEAAVVGAAVRGFAGLETPAAAADAASAANPADDPLGCLRRSAFTNRLNIAGVNVPPLCPKSERSTFSA